MSLLKRIIKKPIAYVLIIILYGCILVAHKLRLYAADPVGEKDCPSLVPAPTDPSKQTTIVVGGRNLPWEQKGGTINDASCLDRTPVYGIVSVKSEEDVVKALRFASENKLKVSAAGVRHSMGGQAFYRNAVILDMKKFNRISLNAEEKTVTVESGATWHDIQNVLHPRFAVKAMQSTDIFTVGGSISVNAHGMDHTVGSVAGTIRSMRIMLADGSIKTASRTENPELFRLAVGGYGLFGVILNIELEITENEVYERDRRIIGYREFPALFKDHIANDPSYRLLYGHLSTSPGSYLEEMIVYAYKTTDAQHEQIPALAEVENVKLRRLVLNLSKHGSIAKRIKWFAEKYLEPKLEGCSISRTQAMGEGEACLVSRNEPMHDSVNYLRNNLPEETDILHEYFIPRDKLISFIDGMRDVLRSHDGNLLNASVRVVHKEDVVLNYAPEDMFAVVLYLNQRTNAAGNEHMRALTADLIDLTLASGGRFFLPYQLYYTDEQLERAYPEIGAFFAAKSQYDPEHMFTNTFYETYASRF